LNAGTFDYLSTSPDAAVSTASSNNILKSPTKWNILAALCFSYAVDERQKATFAPPEAPWRKLFSHVTLKAISFPSNVENFL
jgi:hypothetical protein